MNSSGYIKDESQHLQGERYPHIPHDSKQYQGLANIIDSKYSFDCQVLGGSGVAPN